QLCETHDVRAPTAAYIPAQMCPYAGAARPRDFEILGHREVAEYARHLEFSADAGPRNLVLLQILQRLAVERDRAGARLDLAADDIERRGLAGPVWPDQATQLNL